MTKAYQQMSVGDAVYTAARKYPGSVEALAVRMGKSPKVLRSKLTPDDETHVLTLEEAIQIIELLDCSVPHAADQAIKAIAYRLGRVVVRHGGMDYNDAPLAEQGLAVCAVVGLMAADLAASIDGDKPIPRKLADTLHADIARALDALTMLKDSVEQLTEAK